MKKQKRKLTQNKKQVSNKCIHNNTQVDSVTTNAPLVSVVMPSLNVRPYIEECILSVINQTLIDIEILCVDAGSNDGTLEILKQYAEKDKRIRIIISSKRSYGYQVNLGIREAKGTYIGIVETDDYISLDMYEKLFLAAETDSIEIVKANFSRFEGDGNDREFSAAKIASHPRYYNCILNPQKDPSLLMEAFYTWAGIYNRNFLISQNIFHNESPGASYQDNGFYFQTLACASKMLLLENDLYKLRRDNPNSSINNKDKVFVVCDEYQFIYTFLIKNKERKERFAAAYWINCYRAYFSTYKRISIGHKLAFLKRMSKDMTEALIQGEVETDYFNHLDMERFRDIVNDPVKYYYRDAVKSGYKFTKDLDRLRLARYENVRLCKLLDNQYKTLDYRIGRAVLFLPRKIYGGYKCLKENGFKYTIIRCFEKSSDIIGLRR